MATPVRHYRARPVGSAFAPEVQKSKNTWKQLASGRNLEWIYKQEYIEDHFRIHAHDHKVHAYQIEGIDAQPVIAVPFGFQINNLYDSEGSSYRGPGLFIVYDEANRQNERYPYDPGYIRSDVAPDAVVVFTTYTAALAFARAQAGEQEFPYDTFE